MSCTQRARLVVTGFAGCWESHMDQPLPLFQEYDCTSPLQLSTQSTDKHAGSETDVAPLRQRKAHWASSLNKCQRTRPRQQNPNRHPSHHPSNSSSGLTKLIVIPKSTWAWDGGGGFRNVSELFHPSALTKSTCEWKPRVTPITGTSVF
jgi:hypothetical protein